MRKAHKALATADLAYSHTKQQESFDVRGDHAVLVLDTNERIKTLADLVRVCEIDTEEWEIERYLCNKWEVGMKEPATGGSNYWRRESAEPIVVPLFQVKAWLKRRVTIIAAKNEIKELLALSRAKFPARARRAPQKQAGVCVLEINIPDLHLGKLAWPSETMDDPYDGKIAEQLHDVAIDTLISRTAHHDISEVLFVVGNDLLHADTKAGTTTSGTPLDMDSRFHKSFSRVRSMIVRAIDRLRVIAPVRVMMVPGNHDTLSVWHLGDSLDCYYHATEDVTIDNSPTMRKYYRHGKVMLMFTHGNKGKLQDYPLLMATEQPDMFGATRYREAHTGHTHKKKDLTSISTDEFHGVRVRVLPALCSADAWHSENTFTGQQRSAEAFVWHPEEGLVGTAIYNAPLSAQLN